MPVRRTAPNTSRGRTADGARPARWATRRSSASTPARISARVARRGRLPRTTRAWPSTAASCGTTGRRRNTSTPWRGTTAASTPCRRASCARSFGTSPSGTSSVASARVCTTSCWPTAPPPSPSPTCQPGRSRSTTSTSFEQGPAMICSATWPTPASGQAFTTRSHFTSSLPMPGRAGVVETFRCPRTLRPKSCHCRCSQVCVRGVSVAWSTPSQPSPRFVLPLVNSTRASMKIRSHVLLKTLFGLKGNLHAGAKPRPRVFDGVAIAPFKNDARAAACISADFELSWAFRHHPAEVARAQGRRERENIPLLLQIFERCAFPITWATVGHLFLERCVRSSHGLAHPEMPRPPRNALWTGDWYVHDPCTDYKQDPLWYAPDLIQNILE